jgi:hypothetical protein
MVRGHLAAALRGIPTDEGFDALQSVIGDALEALEKLEVTRER